MNEFTKDPTTRRAPHHILRNTPILGALLIPMSGCAPSPAELCDHAAELVQKEAGALPEGFVEECVEDEERWKRIKGILWKQKARCMMKATTVDGLDAC